MNTNRNTPARSYAPGRAPFSATAVAAALALTACGGGGGGGSSTTPSPSNPVDLTVTSALVSTGWPQPFASPPEQRPRAIRGDTLVQVSFRVTNNGPNSAQRALFTVPSVVGFAPTAIVCGNASGGATCPVGLTLQAAAGGVAIDLPVGSSLSFTLGGTVNQEGSIAPRATISAPSGMTDTATANDAAEYAITVSAPAAAALVASVAEPTYAPGSDIRAAYDWLNGVRQRCGFGLLQQDTRLDQASSDHANYMEINGRIVTHTQDPTKPGFTGVNGSDRAIYRGYPGLAGDSISTGRPSVLVDVQTLTTITYHGFDMIGGRKDIGLPTGFSFTNWSQTPVMLGVKTVDTGQPIAGDVIATYPCEGEVIPRRVHGPESPSPIPGADMNNYGPALLAMVRSDQTLIVSTWTIAPRGGVPMATTFRNWNSDVNPRSIMPSEAVLIPNTPLARNTTYDVEIKGTNAGVPFEKRYSFRTGA